MSQRRHIQVRYTGYRVQEAGVVVLYFRWH